MKLYYENELLETLNARDDLTLEEAIVICDIDLDFYSIDGLHLEADDYVESDEDDLNALFGL